MHEDNTNNAQEQCDLTQGSRASQRYDFAANRRTAVESLRQPLAIFQLIDGQILTLLVSDGFCKLFGYVDRERAMRDMDYDLFMDVHPDDIARTAETIARFVAGNDTYDAIYRMRNAEGSGYTVVHAQGEHAHTKDGAHLVYVWYTNEGPYYEGEAGEDFNFAKVLSNMLDEQSASEFNRYDNLTGLQTMSYFFEQSEMRKEAIVKRDGKPVLLYIDFDGMKFFNTRFGFTQGDVLLQLFARMISHAFGVENCCRIGVDHFAAFAEEDSLEDKLNGVFREFGNLYEGKTPPVHVGAYPYGIEDVHISAACDRAKIVCSELKGSYSSGFTYYDVELRDEAMMKQYIVENLDTAIREKWIQVYLQPIIRSVNERVCDVEALARWNDPEKGLLTPDVFIPVLEESGLICKLDLYMVESVLESIKVQIDYGMHVVPHSINLSRIDFGVCDIVEEIRKRVDAAGVDRDRIVIEITESVIGSDFEFMKGQVERFQELGFSVWMDDFGSGYSSLDTLQSIKFNLVKFDMSFMRKLDAGNDGKVILTELVRMMTSLGVSTVCEGVETESQVRFLQEIGCSRLQGFFYSKPLPIESVLQLLRDGTIIKHENPEESDYYESISRVNLYDLDVIAQGDESSIQNTFDTLPMGIIEINGDYARFVRSNQTYRDFVKRVLGYELSRLGTEFVEYDSGFINNTVRACCEQGLRSFYDEKMPDGTTVHSFARQIGENPVTGTRAVAVAVLSISDPDEEASYADIARALATDYYNIYVVDMDTEAYIEYSSLAGGEVLAFERHGTGFFESVKRDVNVRIYEKDRLPFLTHFSKEIIVRELDEHGVFALTYRLIDTGEPVYVNMKITRLAGGNRIILGVSVVDAQMKQKEEEERLRQETVTLGRIAALTETYIVLYTIDPLTGHYVQYNPSSDFEKFGLARQGEDFFADVVIDAPKAIYEGDMERHLRVLTKENMMRDIRELGHFTHTYHLMIDGIPVPAVLRAKMVEEDGSERIILGVSYAD